MAIMATGLDYRTGDLLIDPLADEEFGARLERALSDNAQEVRRSREDTSTAIVARREMPRERTPDLGDPTAVGWTYAIHEEDLSSGIEDALAPLARLRRMSDPHSPLVYDGRADWGQWIEATYLSLSVSDRPHYVLLVGGPDRFPFHMQSLLAVSASVGRVDLPLEHLAVYVEKLLRLHEAPEPVTSRQVLFFGPDYGKRPNGSYDPTYFSRRHMVRPLADEVRGGGLFEPVELLAEEATRDALLTKLRDVRPSLVYTASHGMAAGNGGFELQRRIHGAICCQRTGAERRTEDYLYTAADVPEDPDEPVAEGAVFFQFACFGYGTPKDSDFSHWRLGVPPVRTDADFVSALPKALLAHPKGPIAYVGHVDLAWLQGFDEPNPSIDEHWSPRLVPFRSAVRSLLDKQPVALAMSDLNVRFNHLNDRLTDVLDSQKRGTYAGSAGERAQLAEDFITRTDAQNYLVFGDPGAGVRIPDP